MRESKARMSGRFPLVVAFVACLLSLLPGTPSSAADPSALCAVGKMKLSSQYLACRLKATAATQGGDPADYSRCEARILDRWAQLEGKFGASCPTLGDVDAIRGVTASCGEDIAGAVTNNRVTVEFRLTGLFRVLYTAVGVNVDYSAASGGFVGTGNAVDCHGAVAGAMSAFADVDLQRVLKAGVISTTPFSSDRPFFSCSFDTIFEVPDPADFVVRVTDANNDGVVVPAEVAVSSIHP